jgi:glyceraldehyde-3-phosphate dehydrogenase (NADP+)
VLGLEAKNPAIVLPDAEISQAVEECVLGSLSFNGQRCTALKILFVHRDIFQSFLERFIEEMGSLKRGMPWDAGVKITPLAEPNKAAYLQELVDDAVRHGARVFPEAEFCDGGWGPRVVAPVTTEMRAYHEEQFGPLVPIVSFDRVEEVISYVVASSFGQQVSLFGRDPESLSRLIDPLVNQVCRVNINSQCQRGPDVFPFTGRKDSAEATLSVSDALRAFSIRTMVAAKGSEENKEILRSIVQDRRSKFLSTDFVF